MPLNPSETVIARETTALDRLRCAERHRDIGKAPGWGQPQKVAWPGLAHSAKGFAEYYSKLLMFMQSPEALSERLSAVEEKYSVLQAVVEKLQASVEASSPPPLGEFENWRSSAESANWAGQHVAFLPAKGTVVDSDFSLGKLLKRLEEIDPNEETIVGLVPG